jgi:anti-sigma factor RsiW
MDRQQLEYAISQYVDGTIDPAARAALEQRLAGDAEARQLLTQDRALNDLLGQLPVPPQIDWNNLAQRIADHVAEAPPPRELILRIRPAWAVRFAVAAAVLLAAVGLITSLHQSHPQSAPPAVPSFAQVQILNAVAPSGPATSQVSVGPSPAIAAEPAAMRYSDAVISRPSRVSIAAGETDADDQLQPY